MCHYIQFLFWLAQSKTQEEYYSLRSAKGGDELCSYKGLTYLTSRSCILNTSSSSSSPQNTISITDSLNRCSSTGRLLGHNRPITSLYLRNEDMMLFSATEKSVKLWNQHKIHEEMEQPLPVNSSSLVSVTLLEMEYDSLRSNPQDYDQKSDTNHKVS